MQVFRIVTTVTTVTLGLFLLAANCRTAPAELRMRLLDVVMEWFTFGTSSPSALSKAVPEEWWELHCISMRA